MKKKYIISIVAIIGVLALVAFGITKMDTSFSASTDDDETEPRNYSSDIVFDGDHYKMDHAPFEQDGHVYIALSDLKTILTSNVEQTENKLTITYEDNQLKYENGTIQNGNAKEDDIQKYHTKDDNIYLPDQHIEKFLGVKVDYFYTEKTGTIALSSPAEQLKQTFDQQIGTTIFLHKEDVTPAKYEPRDGIYLGGYVIQDEYINTSMNVFNELAGKDHASYFRYVGYGKPFPKEWVEEVKSVGGFPQIAWEPNDGLDKVKDDEYLRQFAKDARDAGVPILLRYASEMNGNWTAYSGDPKLHIEKWKLVHDVMEAEAPNVMMLWNVFTMPEHTIAEYYPGDEYVDYVGVNIYNVVYHNDRLEDLSDFEDPLRLLDYVYNKFSDTKPIVIGEFGATNYTVTDGLYHVDFAVEKIQRMYKYLPALYPRVKMIYYFDVNNLVNAPEGRKINNYAITENERITNAYHTNVKKDVFLSTVQKNASAEETFSYRDFLFFYNEELFVDRQFVEEYLKMEVQEDSENTYNVTFNKQTASIPKAELTIDKAAFFEKRDIHGIALEKLLDAFSIKYEYENGNIHIYQ
ncbi:glycoside hydrolase family 26 protein [Oceanobacillus sp. Castelsardo]|uniref:glycoside hydrolase family 26 protein n=1 Tax=Oceanobacillus sp. Castelsardo TaxID=1851204 RepID=UPI000839619B|nr:glycosyl hydrolase [Oceanobacillus sp. Castelsardo]